MTLQVPDPLHRWRLILGEAGEACTGGAAPALGQDALAADAALDWLYGHDEEYTARGERRAGSGPSQLTTPEWVNTVHTLFPKEVIERLETDAVERFGIDDVVTNLAVLERLEPSQSLLKAVLHTKHLMNPDVLAAARRIVAEVVRQLMAQLQTEVRTAFSGSRNRRQRTRRAVASNFDLQSTLRANLHRWDPTEGRLYLDRPLFNTRTRTFTETWDVVLVVDQSGSMVDSVIHSAVLAACLWNLPGMRTHLVAFDTEVVDLTRDVEDPVELLMRVQLGGGTDIAQAVAYAGGLLTTPRRSIVVVISDFYEGGSPGELVRQVARLVESGVIVLGLAALDRDAEPAYDRDLAQRLADAGATMGAMTPGELAAFVAEAMRGRRSAG